MKSVAYDQTVLPDSYRTSNGENAKIEKSKCDNLSDFQTLCCISTVNHDALWDRKLPLWGFMV